eukprot:scaffold28355_cov57-Phaeocystis_antarctica.AAC.4
MSRDAFPSRELSFSGCGKLHSTHAWSSEWVSTGWRGHTRTTEEQGPWAHHFGSRFRASRWQQLNPPCKPRTATLSRRHLVRHWQGLWLASGRVLEGELEDLAARGRLWVVVRELSAPLLHIEAGKGRVVLEPSGDQLLEVAGASMPHLRRGVDLKEANELLI